MFHLSGNNRAYFPHVNKIAKMINHLKNLKKYTMLLKSKFHLRQRLSLSVFKNLQLRLDFRSQLHIE